MSMSAEQLEAEVAALRLMLRETAQTDATGMDYALRCQRERDEARGQLAAAQRELHRLTHGEDIEGDGVCRHEIDARAARAERDRYRAALRDVAREWPYLDLMDPATVQERDLRGVIDYLLRALHSEQRTAREALEGQTDA